jgi:hypothetical protein
MRLDNSQQSLERGEAVAQANGNEEARLRWRTGSF